MTGSTIVVVNSTIAGNRADMGGGGFYTSGGLGSTLYNTIVANNIGGNCLGSITNGGNNIDSGTSCGWGSDYGSRSNTDPQLGALANNGGPTPTMALQVGSPAINGVTYNAPNNCPAIDQRGYARSGACDIGAYEYGVSTPTLFLPLILR